MHVVDAVLRLYLSLDQRNASWGKQCKWYSHWQLSSRVCEVKTVKADECLMTSHTPLQSACRHEHYWRQSGLHSALSLQSKCLASALVSRCSHTYCAGQRRTLAPPQQQLEVSAWIIWSATPRNSVMRGLLCLWTFNKPFSLCQIHPSSFSSHWMYFCQKLSLQDERMCSEYISENIFLSWGNSHSSVEELVFFSEGLASFQLQFLSQLIFLL